MKHSNSRPRLCRALAAAVLFAAGVVHAAPVPVELTVPSGEVTLAGALYLPAGEGPFPAVVVVHGSEPGHRRIPGYIRWAERLRDRGLAVLIWDKRGVGDSGGEYIEAPDLAVSAGDVLVWVSRLATRDDIRPDRVGVLGWSQGGWVGPLAASRSEAVAFVVAISGPGVSPLEQNIFDKTNRFRATGASEERVAQFNRAIRRVWTYIAYATGKDEAQQAWDAVAGQSWFDQGYEGPPMMDREPLLRHPRMKQYVEHQTYDPVPALERVRVPVLAVFGGADGIVPVEASIAAMQAAFREAGNDRFESRVFPGADHGIMVAGKDGARLPAPGFHDFVGEWLEKTAEARRGVPVLEGGYKN